MLQIKGVPLIGSPRSPLLTILQYPLRPSTIATSRPGISIPIDYRSNGLLMANNRRQTRRRRIEQSQRMCIIMQHPAITTDRRDVM